MISRIVWIHPYKHISGMEAVEEEIELINQRRVSVPTLGIHYNMALSRPSDHFVAWKGRFTDPKAIVWQRGGEPYSEFRKRADLYFRLESNERQNL